MYVESYQWQIGLERILILPLAPCGFDTPYLSLPPLGIATMIPCTWGLSTAVIVEKLMDENAMLRTKRKRLVEESVDALKQHLEDKKELVAARRGD